MLLNYCRNKPFPLCVFISRTEYSLIQAFPKFWVILFALVRWSKIYELVFECLFHFYCTHSDDTFILSCYSFPSNILFLQCEEFTKNSRIQKQGIKTVTRPPNKLKSILNPVKNTILLCTPVAYEVHCKCRAVGLYKRKKRRLTSTKTQEHSRHTINEDMEKSSVA